MKRAIVLLAFGTTVDKGREENILPLCKKVEKKYIDYDVFLAFTSRIVVKRLKERNIFFHTEVTLLEKLKDDNYKEIYIQPLHIIGGAEFEKVKTNAQDVFKDSEDVTLRIGRPLLFYMGQKEKTDDFGLFLENIQKELSIPEDEGLVLVGHGGMNAANSAYSLLQLKAWQMGLPTWRVVAIESYPYVKDTVSPWWYGPRPKTLHVVPLLLVAGEHVMNDIFSAEEDSIASQIENSGFTVVSHLRGLGSRHFVQELFMSHIDEMIK